MPDQTYQLPRDSTMQGIVTQLQTIASRMNNSGGSGGGSSYDDTALVALVNSKSTVVANPQGTPDGELTAIEIDGNIYEIVGSGGSGSSSGGSGYEATLIYDGSVLSSLQSSIELDEEWDNYDAIVFTVNFGSNQSKTSGILYKDMLTANIGKIVGIAGFASVYAGATVNSDKKTFSNIYGGGDIQNIYGVYGLKFGAGGSSGGSGYEETELWSGSPTMSTIQLSDSVLNYDAIYVECKFNDEAIMGNTIDKATFDEHLGINYISLTSHAHQYFGIMPASTATSFVFFGNGVNGCVRVLGLKYGSGGSSENSSSTPRTVDHIYTNSAREIVDTITLQHPYTDYDYLVIEISDIAQYTHRRQSIVFLKEQLDDAKDNGGYIAYYQSANAYAEYAVTNTTTLTKFGAAYECITDIYGVKVGGGSSSGEPYSRTELFKSSTPQSGVISLSDAIDNYDDIEIVMGWVSAQDTASHTERFDAEYFINSFPYVENPTNANSHALLEMWANNGFSCAVGNATNTALQTWGHNGGSGIMAVYGIKYGSGSSSSQEEYSTTEKVIGTWIDGKPIYRKVYYSANGFAQWGSVAVDVSDLNIELLIRSDTVNYAASNNSVSNLSTLSGIANRQMWIELGTGSLYLVMDDVKYIILEYTKTTD